MKTQIRTLTKEFNHPKAGHTKQYYVGRQQFVYVTENGNEYKSDDFFNKFGSLLKVKSIYP